MRAITKITIIIVFVGLLVWIGVAGAKWADAQGDACGARWQQAIDEIRSN